MLSDPAGPLLDIKRHCQTANLQDIFRILCGSGQNVHFVEIPGREIDLLSLRINDIVLTISN